MLFMSAEAKETVVNKISNWFFIFPILRMEHRALSMLSKSYWPLWGIPSLLWLIFKIHDKIWEAMTELLVLRLILYLNTFEPLQFQNKPQINSFQI